MGQNFISTSSSCWEHKPQLGVDIESYLDFVSVTCIINMLPTISVFSLSHHILSTYLFVSLISCHYIFLGVYLITVDEGPWTEPAMINSPSTIMYIHRKRAHIIIAPFPSPAQVFTACIVLYCKQWKAGQGSGNEVSSYTNRLSNHL